MGFLVLLFALASVASASSALGLVLRVDLLADITSQVSARVQSTINNDHPPPFSPNGDVTFHDFTFNVALQSFAFAVGAVGWDYVEQYVEFQYQAHPGIFSQSGKVYIFTTNQNHKSLTVDAVLNFAGSTPSIDVVSSSYYVETGDLFVVGTCSDTICLIPVSDIINPIAAQFIPSLQKSIQTAVQAEGTAFLDRLSTFVKVQLAPSVTLVFDEEGSLDVLPDGSLAYVADGATLVIENGKLQSPPVANPGSLPPASSWGSQNDVSVALSPFFFSTLTWALGASGALDVTVSQAPPSSPIQFTTNNAFFKAAMPGLANYSGLNLTLSLSPLSSWSPASVNASGLTLGPTSFQMSFSIVNHGSVVLGDAVAVNLTMTIELATAVSLAAGNKVALQLSFVGHQSSVALIQSKIGAVNLQAFDVLITFAFALAKLPPATLSLPADFTASSVSLSANPGGFIVLGLDGVASLPPAKKRSVARAPVAQRRGKTVPALTPVARPTFRPSNGTQLCGNGSSQCAAGQTCCYGSSSPFLCYATPHGSCCSTLGYCCPEGMGCTSDNPPQCANWG